MDEYEGTVLHDKTFDVSPVPLEILYYNQSNDAKSSASWKKI